MNANSLNDEPKTEPDTLQGIKKLKISRKT
jgi:hypothetical protein